MELLGAVVIVLVVLYARDQIRYGVMTTGTLMAFLYALFKVYEPVKRLGGIYHHFQQAIGASSEFLHILEMPEESAESAAAAPLPKFSRMVEFAGGRGSGHRRQQRGGEDHAGEPAAPLSCRQRGRGAHRWP
jgi:subfamily B ATP-binding cassette protein MsbA